MPLVRVLVELRAHQTEEVSSFINNFSNCSCSMESDDSRKQDIRRRRRRRPGGSVPGSPLTNEGVYTSTDQDRGSSAHARSDLAPVSTPSEHQHAQAASFSLATSNRSHGTRALSPADANAFGSSPRLSPDTRRHTGKRRASGEVVHRQEEVKVAEQDAAPQDQAASRDEIRRPDLPERAVVSRSVAQSHPESSRGQVEEAVEEEPHTPAAMTTPHLRVSTRRTTTTTRWSPSVVGARERPMRSDTRRSPNTTAPRPRCSATSPGSTVTPPTRPISNATRNINFAMLQPHFERPLQQAADSFGVCTTLLKKICRRNGIRNWPYRKICGLRKSIASMAKQVNYFDGEQKRAYAEQLEKLERELEAYLRTGIEPTEDFLRMLDAEVAAAETEQVDVTSQRSGIDNEDEEKEVREVPPWTARPSIVQPHHDTAEVLEVAQGSHSVPGRFTALQEGIESWRCFHPNARGPPLQPPSFPTIATHHRTLPSIASILQHQSYSSPSRAASTQDTSTAPQYEDDQHEQPQWRYFPPTNDEDASQHRRT